MKISRIVPVTGPDPAGLRRGFLAQSPPIPVGAGVSSPASGVPLPPSSYAGQRSSLGNKSSRAESDAGALTARCSRQGFLKPRTFILLSARDRASSIPAQTGACRDSPAVERWACGAEREVGRHRIFHRRRPSVQHLHPTRRRTISAKGWGICRTRCHGSGRS